MNQLDLVKATGKLPIFETIPFSEYRAGYTGELMVRVNPSRKMERALLAAHEIQDDEAALRLTAELIPLDTDNPNESIPYAEFKAWLDGQDAAGADDDTAFSSWLIRVVWERVNKHFLSVSGSKNN